MNNKAFVVRKLTGVFAVSVGGAILVNWGLDATPTDSTLAGIMLFVVCELFILLLDVTRVRATFTAVSALTEGLADKGSFSNFFIALTLERARRMGSSSPRSGIDIPREDVARVWTECIAHVDSSLQVASHVTAEAWWDKDYSWPNLALRKIKAQQHKVVRTLFLWEKPTEVAELAVLAKEQRDAGIAVAHESLSRLRKDEICKAKLDRIGTADFGLIDGEWVFLHFLDRRRRTNCARITRDREIVSACRHLLEFATGNADFSTSGSEVET